MFAPGMFVQAPAYTEDKAKKITRDQHSSLHCHSTSNEKMF